MTSAPSFIACWYARSVLPGKTPLAPLWVMISGLGPKVLYQNQ
jgi:hypothetical protein